MSDADIILYRDLYEPWGTYGRWFIRGDEFSLAAEREWDGNKEGESCVPIGLYKCRLKPTSKKVDSKGSSPQMKNMAFELFNDELLQGRWGIKIHVANSPTQLLGCISLGRGNYTGKYGEKCIGSSTDTCEKFYKYMRENGVEEFTLEIIDSDDCVYNIEV